MSNTSKNRRGSGNMIGSSKCADDIAGHGPVKEAQRLNECCRTLCEHAPYGIIIVDSESGHTEFNTSMCKMLGYTQEELITLSASDIVGYPDIQHMGTALSQIPITSDHHCEWHFRRKDGVTVLTEVTPAQMPDGRVLGVVRHITEEKRAADPIKRNAELEQRLSQSTMDLKAANRNLDALMYSISHDLRAPLRAVDGFSQAVLEDYGPHLPPDGRQNLQIIRTEARTLGKLIDGLLSLSRLSRQHLNKRRVDTGKMVHAVIEELRCLQQREFPELRIADLPPCHADPTLLKEVWRNLLSNAIQHTRKTDSALVEIGCTLEDGQETYFVRDNGVGFDMQYAHKLFRLFQRLHRGEDNTGTGMGLAIVQRIVNRHGGRVWADAVQGSGATFWFTLASEQGTAT